ncbi:glycosyltransferase family 2 protein [Pontibacter sp. Tf4]|uniref:glycosyltransferase family 2 protein n=1 Tax=Pontibacter sp. Tf4 TaxID=2761620 RepID=UPI001628733E|nr:glycosyltransferase family A protein [Pontibacter sp. Tf4]MBB6610338.1 glycosyltransferase family 2 protein [Pontibacter sp. Tf4]
MYSDIKPKVSVIIPCYNQGEFLADALQSVLNQKFNEWECIVINDGSNDRTEEVYQMVCGEDTRFKYFKIPNGGVSAARNFAINNATGQFILPLDADDLISSDYLYDAYSVISNNPDIKVVYSRANYFGDKDEEMYLEDFHYEKLLNRNIIFVSGLFRKDDFLKVGGYNEKMIFGFEDWDFWIALLANGGKVYKLDKVHFFYRYKETSRNQDVHQDKKKAIKMKKQVFIRNMDAYLNLLGFDDPCTASTELKRRLRLFENSKYNKLKNCFITLFS